jgi:lipid-binding SYLF domain-containing protein
MLKTRRLWLMTLAMLVLAGFPNMLQAATPEDLKQDAQQALSILIKANPIASTVSRKAKATIIFPNIVKAGLIFGGAYGEGVLMKGTRFDGYVNSVSVSFGWQAGAQSYGYVVFLMTDRAVQYVRDTHGLEIGVGPTVVVVDEGRARNLSSSTLKHDAYAFIFDQQGLMASLSIEGTKISRIKK